MDPSGNSDHVEDISPGSFSNGTIADSLTPSPRPFPTHRYTPDEARELWGRLRARELARERAWVAGYSVGERARYEHLFLQPMHVLQAGFTPEGNLTHREEASAYGNEAMGVDGYAMDRDLQNLGAHDLETFERIPYGLAWINFNRPENYLDAITGLAGDRDSPSRNILSGVTTESTRCSLSLREIGRRIISMTQNLGAFLSRGTDTRVDEAAAITSSSTSEKFKLSSAFALASLALTLSSIYGLYSVVLARKTEERDHPLLMHSINLAIPIIGCSTTIVVLNFLGLRQGRRLLKVIEALFIVTVVCMLLGLVLGYMVLTK